METKLKTLQTRISLTRAKRKAHQEEVKRLAKQEENLIQQFLEDFISWVQSEQ